MGIATRLVLVSVALAGGYFVAGSHDFTATVHRPMPEVYSTFSGVRTFTGGLRRAGLTTVNVTTQRPSDHELIYVSGDAEEKSAMRIAFTFEPGHAGETVLHAQIHVPAVKVHMDGKDYRLSESKVRNAVQDAVSHIAQDLDAGRPTDNSTAELNQLLDMVALATRPEQFEGAMKRVET